MGKGANTRRVVLDTAVDLASEVGLETLSFGNLAKRAGLSKSGLYAHFDTKEALQVAVLDAAAARWVDIVLSPALKQPRGEPRIRALFEHWLRWERDGLTGGCIFIGASTEFDDRPGIVRDSLVAHWLDMQGAIGRAARIAVDEGHLDAELDTAQFAFEFWSILLGYHHSFRLLGDDAVARARISLHGLLSRSA